MNMSADQLLRAAAIAHVEARRQRARGGALSWADIAEGFFFQGRRLHLANKPRGIFWPAELTVGALSIKTTIPRRGREARYDDQIASEAPYFEYRHQGEDPGSRDNDRLRQCWQQALPLIYFHAVAEGRYEPLICMVTGEDTSRRCFLVVPVDELQIQDDPILRQTPLVRFDRRYAITEVRRRLHQACFREAVLGAYQTRCAVCALRHGQLLDAAHIIPDRDKRGEAMVPNGLALCKLHHAAYDAGIMGITAECTVCLREDILLEVDGPLLDHGLKQFHQAPLRVLPHAAADRPDRDLLAERFAQFLSACG